MIWLLAPLASAQDLTPDVPPEEAPSIAADQAVAPAVNRDAERLLGPAPDVVPASTTFVAAPTFDPTSLWPLAAAGIGAGLLWAARRRLGGRQRFESQLLVVGRASLGGSASLVLIDVAQPGGAMRRLVVATGTGTPTLLADLGDDGTDRAADEDDERALPSLRHNTYAATAAASAPRADRKAAAMALIDEVVGTRRVGQS